MTINEKYLRFKSLKKDLSLVGMDAMNETREDLLSLQREQLSKGYGNDDQRLGTYAWDSYERQKTRLYPESGGWVNLKLTGDYHKSIVLKLTAKTYTISATDSKEAKLYKMYGDRKFGLSPMSMQEYRKNFFWGAFMKRVIKQVDG